MTFLKQLNGESFRTLIMGVETIIKSRPITMKLSDNVNSDAPYHMFISRGCRNEFKINSGVDRHKNS